MQKYSFAATDVLEFLMHPFKRMSTYLLFASPCGESMVVQVPGLNLLCLLS